MENTDKMKTEEKQNCASKNVQIRVKNWAETITFCFIGASVLWHGLERYKAVARACIALGISDMARLLRIIGLILATVNLLIWKKRALGGRAYLLYGICLLDALASFTMRRYGLADSMMQVEREIITVSLFYCAAQRGGKNYRSFLHLLYWMMLLLWSVLACLSLCQFVLQIGTGGMREALVPFLKGNGYYGHRLYGVFPWPEFGAVTSLLLILSGAYFFFTSSRKLEKIALTALNIPLLLYMMLSMTRNAQAALYLCLFSGTFLSVLKRPSLHEKKAGKTLLAMAAAVGVVLTAHVAWKTALNTAEYFPRMASDYSGPLARNRADLELPQQEPTEEKLLERIDTKDNISTNRFYIWADYMGLWKEYGLIGLSSTKYGYYIQEHHPDLFVCLYAREKTPDAVEKGLIYHPHNGYLMTLVSTGFLGFSLLLLFLGRNALDVLAFLRNSDSIPAEVIFPLLIVLAGCFASLFDIELFFVFNPVSDIFWICFGLLIKNVNS